jgi:peroxin-6
LLRPGRFDKLLYVPIPRTQNERVNILKALLRKLPVDSTFKVEKFVEKCPLYLSGADFMAITSRARYAALKRLIKLKSERKTGQVEDFLNDNDNERETNAILLTDYDFLQALDDFQPTLNEQTLVEYEKYFYQFSNK